MLEIGMKAPEFVLPDQNGKMHRLSDYRGQKVILYFYPKDNTSGCTKQACGFSERNPQFREKGAVVLGVSKDSVASHKKFEQNYGLGFTLLSDPELVVIKAYGVWQEKKNYGKVTMGVVRTTYLIDEDGIVVKAMGGVKAADNPQQMLDLVLERQTSEGKPESGTNNILHAYGIAAKYADPAKIDKEKDAWAKAAVAKHQVKSGE